MSVFPIAHIPLLNPVRFRGSLVDQYYSDAIPFFEYKHEHFQPWQHGDTIRVQFSVSTDFVDISAPETWVTLNSCTHDVVAGSFIPEVVRFVSGMTYNYTFVMNVPAVTGYYFIKIKLPDTTLTSYYYWYSEGLNIKATHEGTVLLKYTCDGVFHDMYFEYPSLNNIEFYHRFKGGFKSKDITPSSVSNIFADQSHSMTILSAIPYNVKKLTIGDNYGIPNYEIDFLNRAFCCETITIDGVSVCKTETGIEQIEYAENVSKGVWKIELAESPNDESITYSYLRPAISDEPVVIIDLDDIIVTHDVHDMTVIDIPLAPSAHPSIAVLIDSLYNTYPIGVQINSPTQIALNLTDFKPDKYKCKIIY